MTSCWRFVYKKLYFWAPLKEQTLIETSGRQLKLVERYGEKNFTVTEIDGCTKTYNTSDEPINLCERCNKNGFVEDLETFKQYLDDEHIFFGATSGSTEKEKKGLKLFYKFYETQCKAVIEEPSGWVKELEWTEPHKRYILYTWRDSFEEFEEMHEFLKVKEKWLKSLGIKENDKEVGPHGGKIRSYHDDSKSDGFKAKIRKP